jgi:hypothetical protein
MNQVLNISLRDDIADEVRHRILLVLQDTVLNESADFELFLAQVGRLLLKRYGFLSRSGYKAARRSQNPVVEHFACCDEEQFLCFLEVSFQQEVLCGNQNAVDEINEIFRQSGSGYSLTRFIEHRVEKEAWIVPGWKQKGTVKEYEYPKAIRSTDLSNAAIGHRLHLSCCRIRDFRLRTQRCFKRMRLCALVITMM